jgi:hypothetical protein
MTARGLHLHLSWSSLAVIGILLVWLVIVVPGLSVAPLTDAEALAVLGADGSALPQGAAVPVDGIGWRAVLGMWIGAGGDGPGTLRLPSAIAGAIVLAFVAAIGRRAAGGHVGLIAMLLLGASAPFVLAGSRGGGEMAAILCTVAAALVLLTGPERGGPLAVLAATLLGVLAVWSSVWSAPALAALAAWVVLQHRRTSADRLAPWAGPALIVALGIGAALVLPLAVLGTRPEVEFGLGRGDALATVLRDDGRLPTLVAGVLALGAAAITGFLGWRRRDATAGDLIILWALLPLGVAGVLTGLRPVPTSAIAVSALPAVALAIPIVVKSIRPALLRVAAVGGLAAMVVLGTAAWASVLPPLDQRAVAAYLAAERLPGDVVVVGPTGGLAYDYHAGRPSGDTPAPPRVAGEAIATDAIRVRVVSRGDGATAVDGRLRTMGFVRAASVREGDARIRSYHPAAVDAAVVVYGGTPGGIAAAVSAARAGADTVLLLGSSPLGGMMASGLSATDIGARSTVGGLALEVFERFGDHYGTDAFGQTTSWNPEPHVARSVFATMLEDSGVRVLGDALLDRERPLERDGVRISAIMTTAGTRVAGDVFIDASYEGDLLAQAGVAWTIGREARTTYGESLAGVQPVVPAMTATDRLIGTSVSTGRPLPGVQPGPTGAPGSADRLVQPATFRLCVTQAGDRIPFPRPTGYRASHFALLERWLEHRMRVSGREVAFAELATIQPIPGGKGDLNNGGLVSTDAIGLGHGWAEADDRGRRDLWAAHHRWVAGFLYYLTSEAGVSPGLQAEARSWGLCPDEFTSSENWPPQLYIREARRMVAPVVLTQRDLLADVVKPDPVAVGSYRLDVHTIQRVLDAGGYVRGEGSIDARPPPYHIPLGSMLPDPAQAENLVVPVAISASHVAWASMRMEPVFLQLGESAGALAALAVERGMTVHQVPYLDLRLVLEERGSRLGVVGR